MVGGTRAADRGEADLDDSLPQVERGIAVLAGSQQQLARGVRPLDEIGLQLPEDRLGQRLEERVGAKAVERRLKFRGGRRIDRLLWLWFVRVTWIHGFSGAP